MSTAWAPQDDGHLNRFLLGEVVHLEETRQTEFKAVSSRDPVRSIINTADENAVAFLNSEGGSIFWGIRDFDRVVIGVPLSPEQRDELRRGVMNKLDMIQPQIDPSRFRLEIQPVGGAKPEGSLFVVELSVPNIGATDPFYTGGHELFVRIDGVKKKLSGPQVTDWIKTRLRASRLATASVVDPKVSGLIARVRRIFTAHGLEPSHLARFLKVRRAPFSIELTDFINDGSFVAWLSDEKINWIADEFLIRREWIDGEDEHIHERHIFDKDPEGFFTTVGQHADSLVWEDVRAVPEAYFIRWGKGKEWRSKGEFGVFVVLAVPLARFSNERIVFKYISDFEPHPWDYPRTHIQLRAWARLLFHNKRISCHGREMSFETGKGLKSNAVFLHELIEDPGTVSRMDWHPEDYALSSRESAAAKDVDNLPAVLEFLRSHKLPG